MNWSKQRSLQRIAPGDCTQRIDRFDLRSLVDDQQIERDRALFEELGYRQRTHHEDRFDLLNDGRSPVEKLSYR